MSEKESKEPKFNFDEETHAPSVKEIREMRKKGIEYPPLGPIPGTPEWEVMKYDLSLRTLNIWLSQNPERRTFYDKLKEAQQDRFREMNWKERYEYYTQWMRENEGK